MRDASATCLVADPPLAGAEHAGDFGRGRSASVAAHRRGSSGTLPCLPPRGRRRRQRSTIRRGSRRPGDPCSHRQGVQKRPLAARFVSALLRGDPRRLGLASASVAKHLLPGLRGRSFPSSRSNRWVVISARRSRGGSGVVTGPWL